LETGISETVEYYKKVFNYKKEIGSDEMETWSIGKIVDKN
jgi:hypothetical protein